ncbi:helix-turn-helix domain-containing protein [Actinomadura parmotrematis]|uniref:Helix-turn-helix transcriptional regulator n=1 Tax=Actinomadura parmotrematis TaxID=2864039 RepID=A0ABS7FUT6_9ACTN|nr:helix-turn-helix transcriptional regulator [Actinomadura parmotrematis]MBW8484158.1 helix-turn-helix transcriptional regulator [Actinomadura parmotrematis]
MQPTTASRRFGEIVNGYREAAKITRATLANKIFVSPSFMGRIINGTSRCKLENAEKLDKELNAGGAIIKAWKRYIEGSERPRALTDYSELEATATTLRSVQTMYVDGLLQTEDYARALLRTDKNLKERAERQRMLEREDPPTVYVIHDESVLYREVGSPKIMSEQLNHLLNLSERRNVHIQIARYSSYRDLSVSGSYALAIQQDLTMLGFMEANIGGETVHAHKILSVLMNTFTILQGQALNFEDSRAFMRKAIEKWN